MENEEQKVYISLKLRYKYESEIKELKELLKQIIDLSIVESINYERD